MFLHGDFVLRSIFINSFEVNMSNSFQKPTRPCFELHHPSFRYKKFQSALAEMAFVKHRQVECYVPSRTLRLSVNIATGIRSAAARKGQYVYRTNPSLKFYITFLNLLQRVAKVSSKISRLEKRCIYSTR